MTDVGDKAAWKFVHAEAAKAEWKPGLREIFDYRDLGFIAGTNGDYIAHIIKANGKKQSDEVQEWHLHECTFQFVLVLNGSATFEYEGEGVRTIRKGDAINQRPWIAHREIEWIEQAVAEMQKQAQLELPLYALYWSRQECE